MAKNPVQESEKEPQRLSRKEVLRARKHEEQNRQVKIALSIILGLLALVLVIAVVIEYFVTPSRAIATVNGTTITLGEWQDRVRYQRAQFIINLEDQLEAFGDVGLVQQFSGQQMNLLLDYETLGQLVLDQLVDEALIRQQAVRRGITVSQADIEARIAESFSYFGGDVPTPFPTGTATILPTPSLTPIPTEVITEVLPTNTPFPTPTLGPTNTPRPTATAVSETAYQEERDNLLGRLRRFGVGEETYRLVVEAQLYREKLAEALGVENNVTGEVEQASLYVLTFETEADASEAAGRIATSDFLTVWNTIRSQPADAENRMAGIATESLWRSREQVETSFGATVANTAFTLELNTTSDVLTNTVANETSVPPTIVETPGPGTPTATPTPQTVTTYYLIQVSGRELRDLGETQKQTEEQQLLSDLIQGGRSAGGIDSTSTWWQSRTPRQPILDPKFLAQPTAVPTSPPVTPEVEPPTATPEI